MRTKRIIPCLDVKDGRTVKGVNFVDIKDAGDIIELATKYEDAGADELVLLDITATTEDRSTTLAWISDVAGAINIPFTIGGGIRSVEDAALLLSMGASKISINSAAVNEPELINEIAEQIGSECLVVAIDAKLKDGKWQVVVSGGNVEAGRELVEWAKEVEERGAGEILFTSMSHDGMQTGFPIEALASLTKAVKIPVIASGGAGKMEDFYDAFAKGGVDAALAASVFHFGTIAIPELKKYLIEKDINVSL